MKCPSCGNDIGYRYCLDNFHAQDIPVVANLKKLLEMLQKGI